MTETLTSDWSATSSATYTPTSWYLKDPTDATYDLAIDLIAEDLEINVEEQQEVVQPLGDTRDVVIRGEILGTEFTGLTFMCFDQASYDALVALRSRQSTLLLQSDMTEQWYVNLGSVWKVKLKPTAGRITAPFRTVTTTAVEATMPA